jgi:hypothetical protein
MKGGIINGLGIRRDGVRRLSPKTMGRAATCTFSLSSADGVMSSRTNSRTLGTHLITTVYSGNDTYNRITSSTLPQAVNPAKPSTPESTRSEATISPCAL